MTSSIERPAVASADRNLGSVLDGPGSMIATPPAPWITPAAMIRGRSMKFRSKYDSPDDK